MAAARAVAATAREAAVRATAGLVAVGSAREAGATAREAAGLLWLAQD